MTKPSYKLLINSTLAFVSAFTITTIIHEGGHYLASVGFGGNPVLYHNAVYTPEGSISRLGVIIRALAGPFISLVQGLVFALIVKRNKSNSIYNLLFLWLSLLGFVNFFGYLMMTPISTAGDTGKVAEMLGFNYVIRIIIAVIGLVCVFWTVVKLGKLFSNFIPAQCNKKVKVSYIYKIMFFPIIIGGIINGLMAFPLVIILSFIYPAFSSFVIMSSFGAIVKTPGSNEEKPEFEHKIMISMVVLFILCVLVNRLLTTGVG